MPLPSHRSPIVSAPLGSVASWNLPGAAAAFEGARRALRAGFYEPARSIFRALLPHETDHPEVGLLLVRTELAAGAPSCAEAVLEQLDETIADPLAWQVLRAECALARGQVSRALGFAFAASETDPTDPAVRYLLARLTWLGGQESQAEVQFLSLAQDAAVGPRACAWAVLCGWRQGQRDEVSPLLASLRTDDVVCEALRECGQGFLGGGWIPSDRVDPVARVVTAQAWKDRLERRADRIFSRDQKRNRVLL